MRRAVPAHTRPPSGGIALDWPAATHPAVHEVTCAVDCGTAVNLLGVEAQIQSGVVYGLTAALYGKLTLAEGEVQESNFHDYPMLRMFEMPRVAVHILPSNAEMGGIGDAGHLADRARRGERGVRADPAAVALRLA